MMSTTRRRGPWQVGRQHKAFALMGGVVLDLREAIVAGQEVTINASVVMGSVDVLVDEYAVVICDGRAFMGDYSESRSKIQAKPQPDSLVVRVRGRALMGRVNVKRRPGPAEATHPLAATGHFGKAVVAVTLATIGAVAASASDEPIRHLEVRADEDVRPRPPRATCCLVFTGLPPNR